MAKTQPTHYCVAVDLGATSGRIVIGKWNGKRLTLKEVHRFSNGFKSLNGSDYIDLPGLWKEVAAGLLIAKRLYPTFASVGVDTWGVDYVLVNPMGRLVFPPHAYRDQRTLPGLSRLGRSRSVLRRIFAATGVPNIFYNSSLQLEETITRCPEIVRLASRCLFLPDYFNYLLSGRMENGIAIASTSQLLDVRTGDWSRATLRHFKIPPRWFKKPIPSNKVLGRVRAIPELRHVHVVAVPGHDTACAFDAMPSACAGNDLCISSGTWSLAGFECDIPLLGPDALSAGISSGLSANGRFRPLITLIGLWLLEQTLKEFSARPKDDRGWSDLITRASLLPAPRQLLDIADGNFINPVSMRTAIDSQLARRWALPAPRGIAEYTRLICDSLGKGHASALRTFERLTGRKFARVLIVGGGSKNSLLCQSTARACGVPVHSFHLEGSAVGNIASQLVALRVVPSLERFRELFSRQLKPTVYQPGERP